jgi:hypothetical protein
MEVNYVDVTWIETTGWQDERLQWDKVLYAICDEFGRICYIGKADKDTLYQRLKDPDKGKLGLRTFYVYCGLVKSLGTFNVPSQLLSDAEALLIQREEPWGNVVKPLISEEISLKCDGSWKGKASVYEHKTLRRLTPRPVQRMTLLPKKELTPRHNKVMRLLNDPPPPRLSPPSPLSEPRVQRATARRLAAPEPLKSPDSSFERAMRLASPTMQDNLSGWMTRMMLGENKKP